ncbi:MAG TPA: aldose epimerase family protein [Planctomycetaceae bacterium]|nr:aldose epimerase family protein [Planctomycetaceae bacterium]
MSVQCEPFGDVGEHEIIQFMLANDHGMSVSIINYGAIVTSVNVPDRNGRPGNVTLGFGVLDRYRGDDPCYGAICGRFANRIAFGKFTLDGAEYQLATNNGPHHLHGGEKGFNEAVWQGRLLTSDMLDGDAVGVELTHASPDGDEGYPGNLNVTVRYTLNNQNELRIDYEATTDKPTPLNLTNHCYWNLAGLAPPGIRGNAPDVLDHLMLIHADRYVAVDETLIPTGELAEVKDTPLDFTEPMEIGKRIGELKQDKPNGGYDHCYVIRGEPGKLRPAARVVHPGSGRVMEIETTEPGVQFYTGNFLDGSDSAGGFGQHQGFCLECQHYPDSPNQPEFPNTILRPREVYRQTTIHRFSIEE